MAKVIADKQGIGIGMLSRPWLGAAAAGAMVPALMLGVYALSDQYGAQRLHVIAAGVAEAEVTP